MITYGNDKFTVNNQDTFLYGGEFHYFRVKAAEWQDRIDKIKAAGCNLISTYIPWRFHEQEEGTIDLTGSTLSEKNVQLFLQMVQDSGLFCIVRPGPYIMAEVKNEGIPGWFIEKYPETFALDMEGKPHPTKVVSYLHPVFLEKVKTWYHEVCDMVSKYQISNGGNIIMFQLDNEIAMLHWVTNKSDYHPILQHRFKEQLKRELPDKELPEDAESFDRFLKDNVVKDPVLFKQWNAFKRSYIREYVEILKGYAVEFGINVPFLINVHGFKDFSVYSRGTEYPIGLSQLYDVREVSDTILAGDFYPGHIGYDTFHDLVLSSVFTKAVQPEGQPLFSAEFQSGRLSDRPRVYPQDLDLNARTCIASGMNALNYYMFCAGENGEDIGLFGRRHEWQAPIDSKGNFRPSYFTAKRLGQILQTFGSELVNASRIVDTHIAFIPDYYIFGESDGKVKEIQDRIAAERESFGFDGIYRMLIAANFCVSAVDIQADVPIDLEQVPTLWVHTTKYLDGSIQQRLLDYVYAGGKLILFPQIPEQNMVGEPCRILADALEVQNWREYEGMHTVDILEYDRIYANKYIEFDQLAEQAIAWKDNKPVGFVKKIGKGELLVLGVGMVHGYNHQLDLIVRLAETAGVNRHIRLSEDGVTAVEKRGDNGSFLLVNNYDEMEKTISLYQDNESVFGEYSLRLNPRSGLILAKDYRITEEVVIRLTTGEVTGMEREQGHIVLHVDSQGGECVLVIELKNRWLVIENSTVKVVKQQGDTVTMKVEPKYDVPVKVELLQNFI